ncbi:MAG: SRPBCC family protein [Propionibacteriales bacterium]|nr:SRPBCC family protein [Propionibacteriales bacterium]
MTVKRTLVVNVPADRIYPYLADFETAKEWDSGTVRCNRTSGDGGVGTTYDNVSKFLGRETTLVYTVTALEPDRLIAWKGENASVISDDTITLSPSGTGTQVTYLAEFTFNGFAKYLAPLLTPAVNKLGNDTQKTLREALLRLA